MPGCGVPPPPESRRFSDNKQTSNDTNINDNNNNCSLVESSCCSVDQRNKKATACNQRGRGEYSGCIQHHGVARLALVEAVQHFGLPPAKRIKGESFDRANIEERTGLDIHKRDDFNIETVKGLNLENLVNQTDRSDWRKV